MNRKIEKLLNGKGSNYILPFFWQHGEDEATLREYIQAIHSAGIKQQRLSAQLPVSVRCLEL